jgi:hypothetical protein
MPPTASTMAIDSGPNLVKISGANQPPMLASELISAMPPPPPHPIRMT